MTREDLSEEVTFQIRPEKHSQVEVLGKTLADRLNSECKGPETTVSLMYSRKQCGYRVVSDEKSVMRLCHRICSKCNVPTLNAMRRPKKVLRGKVFRRLFWLCC